MADAVKSPTYDEKDDAEDPSEESYADFTAEEDKLSDEDKHKLVFKLDNMFSYALDHPTWIEARKKMIQCFEYREGDQWTAEEKQELADRHQPDTVNNQISVVVNKLVGDLIDQRYRVGFRGRNAAQPAPQVPGQPPPPAPMGDDQVAKVLTDIMLYIRQSNDLEFEERDMADDGFTAGMGCLDVQVEFDDMLQPEIKVRKEDPLIVFPDPDGRRYDWNDDARFICRAKWWNLDEAVEVYPQAAQEIRGVMSGSLTGGDASGSQLGEVDHFKGEQYVDQKKRRLRIIEVQYKKSERENLCIFADGSTVKFDDFKEVKDRVIAAKKANQEYRIVDRLVHKICVGTYTAGILLEHKETDKKYYSLIPYFAYRSKKGAPYSLITLGLSMQDAINKRESKALHLLSTNQAIYEKTAVDDPIKMAEERAKPDGNIEVRDGALTNQRFQLVKNTELAQAQFAFHQRSQEDLFRIIGLDPRMGQQTGEIRSGSALQKKYAEASKPVAVLFDNIRRTRKVFGKVVLDLIQKYFTPDTTMLITDDQNTSRTVGITAPIMDRIKNSQFDVVVAELDDTDSVQQDQFNTMANILPQILPFGPYWVSKLIGMSQLRDKDQLIQELKSQNGPPPVQPRVSVQANIDALPANERAFFYHAMGDDALAQEIRANPPETTQAQKGQVQMASEAIKNMPKPGETQKQQMEMQHSQLEHQQKMTEIQATHQIKMTEAQTKHHIEQSKHQMAIEKMAAAHATQNNAPKGNTQQ